MKPSFLVLVASDVSETVRFWRDVMQLVLTYHDETIGYAAFDLGYAGLTLSIFSREGLATLIGQETPTAATGHQMYISFPVDHVDETYAELISRGAQSVAEPRDRPEQFSRLAHLSDPDGHLIEIYSPLPTPTA